MKYVNVVRTLNYRYFIYFWLHTLITVQLFAGPGTSAYIFYVCWWYWPYPSNRDASWPKSSRTACRTTTNRTTRETTTAQKTTATRKTRPHEVRDSDCEVPSAAETLRRTRNHRELECGESVYLTRNQISDALRFATDRKHKSTSCQNFQ